MLNVVYFAWVRERVGEPSEQIETQAKTVRDLIEELRSRELRYELAFADLDAIRVAVDQELTEMDASIESAREVAFFPPMTGG